MKNIAVLGSTGSIGTQTLEVVSAHPDLLRVKALSCGRNVSLLERQIRKYRPVLAVTADEKDAKDLRVRLSDLPVRILSGMEGLREMAVMPETDVLVTAIVGMIGILPTLDAIRAGKDIALANKETLVTAGHLIMPLAREKKVRILPVDSEHSAIFQSLNGEDHEAVEEILLTCSGGPFRGMTREQLRQIRPADALKHPNWNMGRKITIDSATLVNKGLEVLEARWLFDVPIERIRVVVQPQSIIHSMVQFKDGGVIAQLGVPDMKLPIQYALTWPRREAMDTPRLDFAALSKITFEDPDEETFRGLSFARRAGRTGGTMPTVFNAANEQAVRLFLEEKIGFLDIYDVIEDCMDNLPVTEDPDTDAILAAEAEVCRRIESRWG